MSGLNTCTWFGHYRQIIFSLFSSFFDVPRRYHLRYLCLVFVMLSRLLIAALWSPEGKGLTSWLVFVLFIVILLLSHLVWYLIVSIPDPCCLSYCERCHGLHHRCNNWVLYVNDSYNFIPILLNFV